MATRISVRTVVIDLLRIVPCTSLGTALGIALRIALRTAIPCALGLLMPSSRAPGEAAWAPCEGPFLRGDSSGDGTLDVSDPIVTLHYLFVGGAPPICHDAADVDDDETLGITDPIRALYHLFGGGPAPAPPYPEPGTDEPCNGRDDDGDGLLDEGCPAPGKDPGSYASLDVFLVSDADWRAAVSWTSVAVWTGGETWCERGYGTPEGVCAYPLLVYHREGEAFDADSIVAFIRRLSPERVTLVEPFPAGLWDLLTAPAEPGGGLRPEQLRSVSGDDLFAFWRTRETTVYAEDDYETAMVAAAYASLINAPLVVRGHEPRGFDPEVDRLLCVGRCADVPCDRCRTLEELRADYLLETGTDRILLVNPDDLDIAVHESIPPHGEGGDGPRISELYSRTSLAAPILAAAKQELILATRSRGWQEVDAFLEERVADLPLSARHLTIVASPPAIQLSRPWSDPAVPGSETWISADVWDYAKLDGDPFLDVAVGRVLGITVGDATSSIARSLHHDRVHKSQDRVYVTRGIPAITAAAEVFALGEALRAAGFSATVTPAGSQRADWEDRSLIVYKDHGAPDWAGIQSRDLPELDNSVVLTEACLTCAFEEASDGDGRYDGLVRDLFCANAVRRGAVAYVGATDTAGFAHLAGTLAELLSRDATIGEALGRARNQVILFDTISSGVSTIAGAHYTLLGDPTFRFLRSRSMPPPRLDLIDGDAVQRRYRLTVPAMRIPIPEEVRLICESPDQVTPLCFTTAVNRELRTFHAFMAGFPLAGGFSPVAVPPGWLMLEAPSLGDDRLWLLRRDPKAQSLFEAAGSTELTDIEFEVSLHATAPDLALGDPEIDGQEVVFRVENRGNEELAPPVEISITLQGCDCPALPCQVLDFYVSPFYDPSFRLVLSEGLSPAEGRAFRVPIPPEMHIGGRILRFEDYPYFHTSIATRLPPNLIQQSYSNDSAQRIMARE